MRKLVYIVICCCANGDEYYHIDSIWTSKRKAEKRREELNSKGFDYLVEQYGCGFFEIEQEFISI